MSDCPVIELNVGGVVYATTVRTLTSQPDSLLTSYFDVTHVNNTTSTSDGAAKNASSTTSTVVRDSKGRYFIDRDGVLFRYVLDFLRNGKLVLPECFHEHARLRQEAEHFRLYALSRSLSTAANGAASTSNVVLSLPLPAGSPSVAAVASSPSPDPPSSPSAGLAAPRDPGYVIVGYRGTFAFGRDGGVADVKFRKLWRILVSGRVSLCREVFRDALNESRDVDRGDGDRYTARFFLKHTFLEQAFDALQEVGFRMVGACGSGTNNAGDVKVGMDTEESKWNHYNEFIFCRGR